jgi:hypothetical protein
MREEYKAIVDAGFLLQIDDPRMATADGAQPFGDRLQIHHELLIVADELPDLIDQEDKIRMLSDPSSEYSKSQADILGVQIDDTLVLAATAAANTGVTGGTSTPYDTNNTVAVTVTTANGQITSQKAVADNEDLERRLPATLIRTVPLCIPSRPLGWRELEVLDELVLLLLCVMEAL